MKSHDANRIELKDTRDSLSFSLWKIKWCKMNTVSSFFSADKPDNVSLDIPATKVCAGVAVMFTCSAGAANPAVQNYTLYKFVDGLTYVSSSQTGVFIQKLYTKGPHNYKCEGRNSLASTSSSNRSLEVLCEFGIEHL